MTLDLDPIKHVLTLITVYYSEIQLDTVLYNRVTERMRKNTEILQKIRNACLYFSTVLQCIDSRL